MKPGLSLCCSLFLLFISFQKVTGQSKYKELPFTDHERLHYDVFYNWGFIWIHAATVDFTVDAAELNNVKGLQLCSSGQSLEAYNWIMEVSGSYSTVVNQIDLSPVKHLRDTREDDFSLRNEYSFDYKNQKIYSEMEDSNTPLHFDTLKMIPGAADLVSTAYQIRSLQFDKLAMNDSIPFKILLGGEYHTIFIRFLGHENCETKAGKQYDCLKFSAVLVAGTIFEGEEEMLVWVTNDQNKVPVMVEAKIIVGSVKASLSYTEGLKYSLQSLLNE